MKKIKNFINKKSKLLNFRNSLAMACLLLMMIVGGIFFASSKSEGQVFGWAQNNWSTLNAGLTASPASDLTTWTKFFSKDANVVASNSNVQISGTSKPFTDTSDTNFNTGTTKNNVYTNGTGAGAKLTLLKSRNATCATNQECTSNFCLSGVCIATCDIETISGQFCYLTTTAPAVTLVYGVITGADGKIWFDRNLGATQVATAYNDTQSYGWYFQWGRGLDGHQISTSGTTAILSSSDSPGHANFIINAGGGDWRNPQNNNLWQGVTGINNPCPSGFRIPTELEWTALISASGITDNITAFSYSSLKLAAAGYRNFSDAVLNSRGTIGSYWSSGVSGANAYRLFTNVGVVNPAHATTRSLGNSIRCIKN